jgi:LmbE family N-acetylglucosaminyl deacetylase
MGELRQGNSDNSGKPSLLVGKGVIFLDPVQVFRDRIIVVAPHMDDEILACGGTIARLPEKQRIHCIYATDGSKSPAPLFSWMGLARPDLASIRVREAKSALKVLGLAEENLQFLKFPDSELKLYLKELSIALRKAFRKLKPSTVLIPFRYDRHPDHVALNRAAMHAVRSESLPLNVFEYFVYYRWSLLPGKDVRQYIRPQQLIAVDIQGQADQKRRALECFTSQTTLFCPWQERAIIPPRRVLDVCTSPECFLRYDPKFCRSEIFSRARTWIRLAHFVEPLLKIKKEQLRTILRIRRFSHA